MNDARKPCGAEGRLRDDRPTPAPPAPEDEIPRSENSWECPCEMRIARTGPTSRLNC